MNMRVVFVVAGMLVCSMPAALAGDDPGWIDRIDVERMVPPWPAGGSAIQKDEVAEIHRLQARATAAEKAQAILARAAQYSESRILCGFHFRSDVTAGQQYGSILAVEMLHHPRFMEWVKDARSELIAAGLTRP